jgi:hypothetical protein
MSKEETARILNTPTHPDFHRIREVTGRLKGGSKVAKGGRQYKSKARTKMELLIASIREHKQRGVPEDMLNKAISANLNGINSGQCINTLDAIYEKSRLKLIPVDPRYTEEIRHYSGMEYEAMEAEYLNLEY